MSVNIRQERPADLRRIETVIVAAFSNAPHTSHTEQHIVDALRRTGSLEISLVAEVEGAVIGHVALSPVVIADGAAGWFGLGPIAVLPECQRRGVGSQLMREALRTLRDRAASGCVVLGEPEYYGRFGFRALPDLSLPGVPREYFLALSFDSARPSGIVTYHEAFAT
jgi:putative acetyltransferase